tara:strand:+ start:4513 stop:5004 length:492 start_codon:yes stop_codon:yes gene_type:complete
MSQRFNKKIFGSSPSERVGNFIPDSIKGAITNKRKELPTSLKASVPLSIHGMAAEAHDMALEKGWWDNSRDIPHCLALVHSEVSEALEAYREYGISNPDDTDYETGARRDPNPKPEGFVYELADILIRVGDLARHCDLDLETAVKEKMEFNSTRGYRHGNKLA